MEAAHLFSAADVLRRFSVTVEGGLRPEQVTSARERYGPNGESAGLAREAGTSRASLSLLPCAATGSGPLRFQPSQAGRKRGLQKLLQMLLGHSDGLRGHLRLGVGDGFRVLRPDLCLPFPQCQGSVGSLQASHIHSRPHPLPRALIHPHPRSVLDSGAALQPAWSLIATGPHCGNAFAGLSCRGSNRRL